MFKKLILFVGLIAGATGFAQANTFKTVLASTAGTVQAGLSGYAMHLSSGSLDIFNSTSVTVSKSFVTLTGSTITANGIANFLGVVTATNTSNIFQSANSTMTILNATTLKNGGVTNATLSTTGIALLGTTTNDNAGTGNYGEYKSTGTGGNFVNYPTTGNYGDIALINLTAGDWDLSCNVEAIANGATVTQVRAGITTTSGNSFTGAVEGDNAVYGYPPTAVITSSLVIPEYRVSLTGSTTYYLKYQASFSVATPQAAGRMSARRAR